MNSTLCAETYEVNLLYRLSIIVVVLLWTVGTAGLYIYDEYFDSYKIIRAHYHKRMKSFQRKEILFRKNPDIATGIELADFYHSKGDYKKALFYCKKCIELGSEDYPRVGALIRFWMSDIHLKLNERELAKENLIASLLLDKDYNLMRYEWISDPELKEIYQQYKK